VSALPGNVPVAERRISDVCVIVIDLSTGESRHARITAMLGVPPAEVRQEAAEVYRELCLLPEEER